MSDVQLMCVLLTIAVAACCCVLCYYYGSMGAGLREINRWRKLLDDLKDGIPHDEAINMAIEECVASHREHSRFTLCLLCSKRARHQPGQTGDTK